MYIPPCERFCYAVALDVCCGQHEQMGRRLRRGSSNNALHAQPRFECLSNVCLSVSVSDSFCRTSVCISVYSLLFCLLACLWVPRLNSCTGLPSPPNASSPFAKAGPTAHAPPRRAGGVMDGYARESATTSTSWGVPAPTGGRARLAGRSHWGPCAAVFAQNS